MKDWKSQARVKWECKYHVVILPTYRKKVTYGKLRRRIGGDSSGFVRPKRDRSGRGQCYVSARHQVRSTLLTANLPFAQWGNVFDSTTMATSIADRFVHNSEVLMFKRDSYRRKPK